MSFENAKNAWREGKGVKEKALGLCVNLEKKNYKKGGTGYKWKLEWKTATFLHLNFNLLPAEDHHRFLPGC